jgi:hypothetical protein
MALVSAVLKGRASNAGPSPDPHPASQPDDRRSAAATDVLQNQLRKDFHQHSLLPPRSGSSFVEKMLRQIPPTKPFFRLSRPELHFAIP